MLDWLKGIFGYGAGGSAGESALAPGAGVTSFMSGKDSNARLYDMLIGKTKQVPGVSEMGGYQGVAQGLTDQWNQNLTSGGTDLGALGGALSGMAGMGQEQGQQQMGMAPPPQMPGMMPMPAPPQGTPPIGGAQAPQFPGMGKLDLQMAANMLKKRLGIM